MGSVPHNRPATALIAKGSAGNPRTKAAAESAVRLAKEARRKSARQSGGGKRGSSRKRSPPEIRAPSQPESAPRQRFAGNPHAKAAAEGVLLRRIAGERSSEQRIQRFEAGQARFAQRKKLAGKPCADLAGVRPAEGFCRGKERAEPAGACPAAAFRREATRGALGRPALRGWTILRSVESAGVRPSSGFSVSKPVRRGSSRGRASPGKNVPSQPELVLRQRFVGKPHAGQTILRSVESSGVRPSSGFSVSKPVRRGSSNGMVLPGKSAEPVGACPAAAFRREAARWADDSTLRRIVGGTSEQRIQRFEAGQARLVQRKSFAGKPRAGAAAEGVPLRRIAGERPSEQRIQCFEAGQARFVQRKKFAGKPRAGAAAEGVLLRRIAGERPSEQRVQRFEVGQARFAQRKKLAGKPCADLAGVRPAEWFCRGKERAEPAGACPAAAFRRGNTRRVRESFALRGWTILRSVESSGVRPSGGFSASKPVRRGSSSGRASPGKNVPSQPELIPR